MPEGSQVKYDRTERASEQKTTITNYISGGLNIEKQWQNQDGTAIDADTDSIQLKLYKRLLETQTSSGEESLSLIHI